MEQAGSTKDLRLYVSLARETSGEWRVGEFAAVYSGHDNRVGIEVWKDSDPP